MKLGPCHKKLEIRHVSKYLDNEPASTKALLLVTEEVLGCTQTVNRATQVKLGLARIGIVELQMNGVNWTLL